jgi:dTMP kinase
LAAFIVFEGAEGVGKSTQIKLLAKKLKKSGIPYVSTREPGGTKAGDQLREILLSTQYDLSYETEALLMAASRIEHCKEVILPALQDGITVISDRFIGSSLAYQGVARGLGLQRIEEINAWVIQHCLPTKTILLNGDFDVLLERRTKRNVVDSFELEDKTFHKNIYDAFETLAEDLDWAKIDSTTSNLDSVAKAVWEEVKPYVS